MEVCHEAETSFAGACAVFLRLGVPEVFGEVCSRQIYIYGDWECIKESHGQRTKGGPTDRLLGGE